MRVFRVLLNRRLTNIGNPDLSEIKDCASILSHVDWNLRNPPWAGLLLVKNPKSGRWTVRSDANRNAAIEIAVKVLRWQTGVDKLDDDGIQSLKAEWYSMLSPIPTEAEVNRAWGSVEVVSEDAKV